MQRVSLFPSPCSSFLRAMRAGWVWAKQLGIIRKLLCRRPATPRPTPSLRPPSLPFCLPCPVSLRVILQASVGLVPSCAPRRGHAAADQADGRVGRNKKAPFVSRCP